MGESVGQIQGSAEGLCWARSPLLGKWGHVAVADLTLGDCGYRNLDIVTDATGGSIAIWSKEMLYLGMLGNKSAL